MKLDHAALALAQARGEVYTHGDPRTPDRHLVGWEREPGTWCYWPPYLPGQRLSVLGQRQHHDTPEAVLRALGPLADSDRWEPVEHLRPTG